MEGEVDRYNRRGRLCLRVNGSVNKLILKFVLQLIRERTNFGSCPQGEGIVFYV